MQYRILALGTLLAAAVLAACGSDDDNNGITSTNSTATVRFVNATNTNISVANGGVVGTGNSALTFGNASTCMTVNTASPNLTFTNSTSGATINTFASNFAANGNYTVIAYTDANGQTQFATLNNSFTPTAGQAGLRVFNAASGSGNIVVNSGGSALNGGSTAAFANSGTFFSMPAGTSTFTFNTGTGTSTLVTLNGTTLIAGQNTTLVLAPPATGSATLRAFSTTGC